MPHNEFKEILTALFNGNAGEAEQAAETISYDSVFNISDEYDRRKQDRINYFEFLKLRKSIRKQRFMTTPRSIIPDLLTSCVVTSKNVMALMPRK